MFTERSSKFSREESEQIGQLAVQAAERGEKIIDSLVEAKIRLLGMTILVFQEYLQESWSMDFLEVMRHEIAVIDEVIRRTRAILKIQGNDLESEIQRLLFAARFGRIGDSE